MSFTPGPNQPDFSSLLVSLANMGAQYKNNALYQTIFLLIQRIIQSRDLIVKDISGTDGSGGLKNATYLTVDDETTILQNSRRLLAGAGIVFNDATPGQRTVSSNLQAFPVGSLFSTAINVNAGVLLGYGTWILFATGENVAGELVITLI